MLESSDFTNFDSGLNGSYVGNGAGNFYPVGADYGFVEKLLCDDVSNSVGGQKIGSPITTCILLMVPLRIIQIFQFR